MSYNEFLPGLIYKDESFVSADHIEYLSLSIYDETFNLLQTKPAGRAVLTDKRMLLVSSQYHEGKLHTKMITFVVLNGFLLTLVQIP